MVDCLPSMGSGIDPLVIGLSLLLLGLGAAAIVWARRKRGAAMFLFLPLVFGLFLFGGASATPAQAADCAAPPAACVADPVITTYSTGPYEWYGSGGDGGDVREVELTIEDFDALVAVFPETGSASIIGYYYDGDADAEATVVIPITWEQWSIHSEGEGDDALAYLDVDAEVFGGEGDPFIYYWDFVYTATDSCGVTQTWTVLTESLPT